jgi:hypothetical protein
MLELLVIKSPKSFLGNRKSHPTMRAPGRLVGPAKIANPGEEFGSVSWVFSPSRTPKGHNASRWAK